MVLVFCAALQNTNFDFVLLKKSRYWETCLCSTKYYLGILCCSTNTNFDFVLLKKSRHWVSRICSRKEYYLGVLCCSVIYCMQNCAAQELKTLVICVALESTIFVFCETQ